MVPTVSGVVYRVRIVDGECRSGPKRVSWVIGTVLTL